MSKSSKNQVVHVDTTVRGRAVRLAEAMVDSHGETVRTRGLGNTMIELGERAGAYGARVEVQVKGGDWSMNFDALDPDWKERTPPPTLPGIAARIEAGDDRT